MKRNLSHLRLVLAGVLHWPGRNAALLFCYACIAAGIFSAHYVTTSTAGSAGDEISRMGADLIVVPQASARIIQGTQMGPATIGTIIRVEPSSFLLNASVMDTISKVPGISAMSPQVFVASLSEPALSDRPFDVYGIDPVSDFTVQPWLARPPENPFGSGEIIIGDAITGSPKTSVIIGGKAFRIAGKLSGTGTAVDRTVFISLEDAYALAATPGVLPPSSPQIPTGSVSAILIRTEPGADPALVGSRVQQPFSYSTLRVLGRQLTLHPVSQEVRTLPQFLNILSLVVIISSLPLIALITAMSVHERQREIGLLAAMGATRSFVFVTVMGESLTLAAAGGLSGCALTAVFLIHAGQFFPLAFQYGFPTPSPGAIGAMAGEALGIVVFVGAVTALWPAYRICQMNPYDAIRSGE